VGKISSFLSFLSVHISKTVADTGPTAKVTINDYRKSHNGLSIDTKIDDLE